jgi:hypothetical protein
LKWFLFSQYFNSDNESSSGPTRLPSQWSYIASWKFPEDTGRILKYLEGTRMAKKAYQYVPEDLEHWGRPWNFQGIQSPDHLITSGWVG